MTRDISLTVQWEGAAVGTLSDPDVEMFYLSGRWQPAESPETRRFLDLLRGGAELEVELGGSIAARIFTVPDEYIEVTMRA